MQLTFDLRDGRSVLFETGMPDQYRGLVLQGSKTYFYQSPTGTIVLQQIEMKDFSIQLEVYHFLQMVKCILKAPSFKTACFLPLNQGLNIQIRSRSTHFKKEEFSFINHSGDHLSIDFKKGIEYQLLQISYSPELLRQVLDYFPTLAAKIEKANMKYKSTLITPPLPAGPKVMYEIGEMMNFGVSNELSDIFYDYQIRECLLLLMIESARIDVSKLAMMKSDRQNMLKLAERMRAEPSKKYPIRQIAREVLMNEMKLKISFKLVNGKSILRFLSGARMEEALRLLKESDMPIKEIAARVGMKHATNFITKFRNYHGFPPSQVNRNSNQ